MKLLKRHINFAVVPFIMSAALLTMTGCGKLDFSQGLLVPLNPIIMSKVTGVEVVSGSAVGQKTVINGYTVDASVGAIQDKIVTRTPNGYSIYNGVKGAIVSGQ